MARFVYVFLMWVQVIGTTTLVSCDHLKPLGAIDLSSDSGSGNNSDSVTDSSTGNDDETDTVPDIDTGSDVETGATTSSDKDTGTDEDSDTLSFLLPLQHLDASVASSVVTDEANVVRQWNDQSGNAHDAVRYFGEVVYPSALLFPTGFSGLDFGPTENYLLLLTAEESDSFLDFDGVAKGKSGFAVLIAFKVNVMRQDDKNDLIGNSTNIVDDSGFYLRYRETGEVDTYLGGLRLYNGIMESGDTAVFAYNYNALTGDIEFWTSGRGFVTGNIAAKDFSNSYPLNLGGFDSGDGPRFMDGIVGEIKIFDAVLAKEQFDFERLSMEQKWVGTEE